MVSALPNRTWTRWITSPVCAAVLVWALPAAAQASPDELAKRHFESGVAYLQQSEYEEALREFVKAHELSDRPELLLNVATVHERMGDLGAAIEALEQYLEAAPEGEHADTVKIRIGNLRRRQGSRPSPTPEASSQETPGSESVPEPEPQLQVEPATEPVPVPASEEEPKRQLSVPGAVLVATGVAAAAGAGITGGLASLEHDELESGCSPSCTDDDVRTGKALAWTSTALTGVAVVSAGVGTVLLLTKNRHRREVTKRPRLELVVERGGGAASATWRF